jgi:hypothetical protein
METIESNYRKLRKVLVVFSLHFTIYKEYFKTKNRFPEDGKSEVLQDLVCSYKQDRLTPKKTVH